MGEFFPLAYIENWVPIHGICHIGAHYAEEAQEYSFTDYVVWFEAHPQYAAKMREHLQNNFPKQKGFEAVLSNVDGENVTFWETSNEYASSVLEPVEELTKNPHVSVAGQIELTTSRFDTIWPHVEARLGWKWREINTLILDTQGSELMILEGMGHYLDTIEAIQTEYSTIEMYRDGPRLSDLRGFLKNYTQVFPEAEVFHGDALFIRNDFV